MTTLRKTEQPALDANAATVVPLVTASEAYPELERLFLTAEREIIGSFRIFDPETKLRSEEGRAIGETWWDLVCHTLSRGVKIDLTICDFDPVFALDLHQKTWRTIRQLTTAREYCDGCQLNVRAAMHPATVGTLKRMLFWPLYNSKVRKHRAALDKEDGNRRSYLLDISPGLKRILDKVGPWGLAPAQYPATHHQKLGIADRRTMFIGGLDLNERRYDDPHHNRPGEQTWHDVSVLTSGPHVEDALHHLETFWHEDPSPQPLRRRPDITFVRTLSVNGNRGILNLSPLNRLSEIEDAHLDLFASAERLIYLETQYFRSRRISRALAKAARRNRELGLILVIPAAPDDVAFEGSDSMDARFGEFLQARAVRRVLRAFGHRAFVAMTARPVPNGRHDRSSAKGAELVYIHSKISIADDARAIVSSANLNGRSMRWDTEAGLDIDDPEIVSNLRQRLFAHWLPEDDADPNLFSLDTAQHAWAELARRNSHEHPTARKGFILPYDVRAAENFGRNLPLVPPEMV
jgi:phosphatidylserine/phosphatidylglycerophosphate/cardiolipin synthase-like enzyme